MGIVKHCSDYILILFSERGIYHSHHCPWLNVVIGKILFIAGKICLAALHLIDKVFQTIAKGQEKPLVALNLLFTVALFIGPTERGG